MIFVAGFGWFKMVLDHLGRLQMVLAGFIWFWMVRYGVRRLLICFRCLLYVLTRPLDYPLEFLLELDES